MKYCPVLYDIVSLPCKLSGVFIAVDWLDVLSLGLRYQERSSSGVTRLGLGPCSSVEGGILQSILK